MIKKLLWGMSRRFGYEVCRLRDEECGELQRDRKLTYREVLCRRALQDVGQLSVEESRVLGELVRKSDPLRPIVEIGTLFGFSTTVMTLFKEPSQVLITVDNYSWNPLAISPEAHYQITRERLDEVVTNHNVRIVRMDKDEFYKTWRGLRPALFFCDADHSYEGTKADLLWARSVGASIICGDDYDLPSESGVRRAVDEMGGPALLVEGLFVL